MYKGLLKCSIFLSLLLCSYTTPPQLIASQKWDVQARVACYCPESKVIRQISAQKIPLYQLEFSYHFRPSWSIWGNIGYTTKSGHSTGISYHTRFHFYPIGLGVKYTKNLYQKIDGYLGIGLAYGFIRVHNNSPYVKKHLSRNAIGGMAKVGLRYRISERYFADAFVDYLGMQFNRSGFKDGIQRKDAVMSGFLFGLGFGISF